MNAPSQATWIRINTSSPSGASFAFDFGQANTIPLLALPLQAPAIQMTIAQMGMPLPGQPFILRGSARVDTNGIMPVTYSCTLENGMAWMIVTGMTGDIIRQCVNGKTLRLKIDVGAMSYFYNFSLHGFTGAIQRAANLYESQFGSLIPDSLYF